jgi:putative DNA primase/helicase
MRREDPAETSVKISKMISESDEYESVPPEFSDDALAAEFTRRYGDVYLYVAPWGRWMKYDGTRYVEDRTTNVYALARAVCRDAAIMAKDERLARKIASAQTVAAVEKLARSDPRHAALPEQFDIDDLVMNTPTGSVDLRTGDLRQHSKEDRLTKRTAVAPNADGDLTAWLRFLSDVTCENGEVEAYLQRLAGYCLTGDVRDHILAFFYGCGSNGKSTLLDLLIWLLGDYAKQVPAETLTEARGERHPTDVANLLGVRLAVSSELEEGEHWAEARIKSLTGDATLSGRYMRQDFFEFRRTHKHVVAGNHRPAIRVVDPAIRRRVHLIPFEARFDGDGADRDMPAKLRAEGAAILAWAIQGCL